jgi:methyl-accepting chemotaxis protein
LDSYEYKLKVITISTIVTLIVLLLVLSTNHSIVSSLSILSKALKQLAAGDLTKRLTVNETRNDEIDQVSSAVNDMTASLNDVLNKVANSSVDLDKGASSLKNNLISMVYNNDSTNKQTTHVASAIEVVSSTMSTMLNSTNEALIQSQRAENSADKGNTVITNAASSMVKLSSVFSDLNSQANNLEKASEKIDNVTDMINSLAGQTNLLALNAAIEAARAGEAGRGFSVVADEVRSLAEQTVRATQDIDDIIRSMHFSIKSLVQAMEKGTDYVVKGKEHGEGATEAISNIKKLVHQVTGKNKELTSNISEVTDATSVISRSIESLAINVVSNTQQGLEVQSYVEEVSKNANDLMSMTKRFTLK